MGFGPALARFTSVRAAELNAVRRVLVAALAAYVVVGVLLATGFTLVAESAVGVFNVPARFERDAIDTVKVMGWVSLAALVAAALGHVQSGLERFRAFTLTNVAGSIAFLLVLLLALSDDPRLVVVAYAALLQWTLVASLRLVALRDVLAARGGWLPERALVRQLVGFSARLQAATMATLANTQTDRVVVGLIAPASTLGQVGIGTQVAEAGRFLAYAAFSPMASRMAIAYAEEGRPSLDELLQRHRRLWVLAAIGAITIGVGASRPAIAAWIGPGQDQAALFAALLIAGYGIGLLPSPAFAYLRAIGRPGLEGVFGVLTVVLNLAATVVLAVLVGATGVIVATACAYALSTVWVTMKLRSAVPPSGIAGADLARGAGSALAAGAATYLAGQALVEMLPRAPALLAVGVTAGAAFAGHLALATGTRPLGMLRRIRLDKGVS
jgi:O-antigen/teichoic acid export membrane protein